MFVLFKVFSNCHNSDASKFGSVGSNLARGERIEKRKKSAMHVNIWMYVRRLRIFICWYAQHPFVTS
jgi:hypothetical protein